ncbi:hypothetical protein FLJC2902T_17250 [Flavobacterium limnosediminis JC2902]|uniref:Uncharacterized protein n=1 Tax=Flavobacterium limnosediminis JC2902 TaxID=1341181 RepID=V6SPK4_9FLAO|nr:hypothetical protein [Flavobacterium limnosediminis]ESU28374.1 hypothetical protein FLJC2902T_17250 [Flavobacterium limnosediminis JC2902]
MKKFNSKSEAFASQNFNPDDVKITGVPERHLKAAHAFINLCIAHDAVNPEFEPDYSDYRQDKYENIFEPGSPSGVGFSCSGCDRWNAGSLVGARLVSESREAGKHVAEICHEDYKEMMVYQRKIQTK